MPKIRVICVGKLKEKYWVDAVKEYSKRLGAYAKLEIVELKESKLRSGGKKKDRKGDDSGLLAEEREVIENESRDILSKVGAEDYVISLEIKGKKLDSVAFAEKLEKAMVSAGGNIDFIIGGSLGTSDLVSKRADFRLSFSDMTFPHQMMRVVLLEQIYRAFRIMRGEPYHK